MDRPCLYTMLNIWPTVNSVLLLPQKLLKRYNFWKTYSRRVTFPTLNPTSDFTLMGIYESYCLSSSSISQLLTQARVLVLAFWLWDLGVVFYTWGPPRSRERLSWAVVCLRSQRKACCKTSSSLTGSQQACFRLDSAMLSSFLASYITVWPDQKLPPLLPPWILLWSFRSTVVLVVKIRLPMQETLRDTGSILSQEDPLEEGMATQSSILARRILWTRHSKSLLWWDKEPRSRRSPDRQRSLACYSL